MFTIECVHEDNKTSNLFMINHAHIISAEFREPKNQDLPYWWVSIYTAAEKVINMFVLVEDKELIVEALCLHKNYTRISWLDSETIDQRIAEMEESS